jgi:PAS domain S-box-containing protein
VGNWETHIPTNYLYWSDEIYRIFGMAPQEFDATVDAFYARVHPDDLDYVLKSVDEAIAGRRSYNVDHRIVRLNGEVRFVHQEAEVTYDEKGNPLRFLGVVQDVTERKQLELKIQESLERRGRQVQLSTEIAQEIAAATNLNDLYQRVVMQVKTQFDYYYTQLLRYDPARDVIELVVGYGEVGAQMLAQGHSLPLGVGLTGTAAATGKSILRSNIAADPDWHPNPLLPDTKGELAVPIKLGEQVLGVLDVQSNMTDLLDADDQLMLEGLCGQIAVAIESTRLRQEMEDRLRELNALQRLMSREGWQAFQATREQTAQAYLFDQTSVRTVAVDELQLPSNGKSQKELAGVSSEGNGHIVAKPMAIQGEIIGGLGIQDDGDEPLTPEDQAFLDAVTEQVAEALERARLLEQTQKRAVEMETVAQVSTAASTILDTDQLLQQVADLTKEGFGLYHAHIYLLNEEGDTLNLAAGAGEVGRRMVTQGWNIPLKRTQSLVARAARTRQTVIVDDVRQNPDFMPNPLLPKTRSEMAIPLMVGDNILGVLDVQADVINRFTDEDERVQTTLAAQVAVALRNATLYQQTEAAVTDLKQSQEMLRSTIDATPDWIFIKDRNHRYRLVNQGYAKSLHLAPEDFIGKNDLEIGLPEEIVKGNPDKGIRGFWADDLEVMDSRQSKFIEVEPAFVDGQPVFLSTIKTPLSDSDGNIWGVLGFVRDITQREQLLAEAENLYKTGRQISEAKDLQEIVAAVAEAKSVTIINRVLLFTFEQNLLDEVEAMTVVANWHSGQGTLPSPIGRRYSRDAFSMVELMLNPEPLFLNDVQHDERMDAPIIAVAQQQNIRAMAVLPLQVGGRQLGVLLLQAEEVHEFTPREIQFYLSLVPQIAIAIDNQRLFAETRTALVEVEQTQRRYTLQTWETYRDKLTTLAYEQVREGVTPLGDNLLPKIVQTIDEQQRLSAGASTEIAEFSRPQAITSEQQSEASSNLIVPLTVRGETIGVLGLQEIDERRKWSPEEISLIEAISEQLAQAAENIRLIDETQQRAAREKRVNEIGEKIQAAQSLEEALKIAVKEVGLSLQAPQTVVKLEVK